MKTKKELLTKALLAEEVDYEEPTDDEVESGNEETEQNLKSEVNWDALPQTDSTKIYMHQACRYDLLTREEEKDLAIKAQAGDADARDKLICSNLRLVINLAKDKIGKGVEFDDLIQEGNSGLMSSVDKYKPESGYRFATYASWWIKESINKCLDDKSRLIKLPKHVLMETNFIKKAYNELTKSLGREPKDVEIDMYLDHQFKEDKFKELLSLITNSGISSLDEYVGDDEKTTLGEVVSDTEDEIKEYMYETDKERIVAQVLADLKPEHRRVMELRYGLGSGETHTLKETAKILYDEGFKAKSGDTPVTEERIRQIESLVIKQIQKNPEKMKLLQELL